MIARIVIPMALLAAGLCSVLLPAGAWRTALAAGGGAMSAAEWQPARVELRGLAIQIHTGYEPVETFVPVIREIAATGANTVLISTAAYMEHARSQRIFVDAVRTPAPADFKTIIREARKLDLHVVLMPIILLTHPRGSEWRGVIEPPSWDEWWNDYRDFVTYFADIARDGGADALMVGSELVSTEKYAVQWQKVIARARERFPGGKLGYSANWDHYKPIQFWDQLDWIGMTSYYTLADHQNPTIDELVARWKPIRDEIIKWQQQVRKPIVMTEVGWCSQVGAAMAPWNYYQNQKATPVGHEEQRRLYEAYLRAWDGAPGLLGVIWWEWTAAAGGPQDYGYTPKGKPAEQVLRRWFAEGKSAPAASPPAGASP